MKKFPLVILHGWNLNSTKFKPLTRAFRKKGFEVYCPDLPGFGKSPLPEKPLMLGDYSDFMFGYLKSNKINKADFICHSFGGRVGIKFAFRYPGHVNRLILTGVPGLMPVPRGKVLFYYYLAKTGKLIFSLPVLENFDQAAQRLLYRAARATDYYNTDSAMRETFQAVVKEELKGYLAKIKAPTLLLWGKNDKTVPSSIATRMNSLIPVSEIKIIEGTAHGFPYSHPEIFSKIAENFLRNRHV